MSNKQKHRNRRSKHRNNHKVSQEDVKSTVPNNLNIKTEIVDDIKVRVVKVSDKKTGETFNQVSLAGISEKTLARMGKNSEPTSDLCEDNFVCDFSDAKESAPKNNDCENIDRDEPRKEDKNCANQNVSSDIVAEILNEIFKRAFSENIFEVNNHQFEDMSENPENSKDTCFLSDGGDDSLCTTSSNFCNHTQNTEKTVELFSEIVKNNKVLEFKGEEKLAGVDETAGCGENKTKTTELIDTELKEAPAMIEKDENCDTLPENNEANGCLRAELSGEVEERNEIQEQDSSANFEPKNIVARKLSIVIPQLPPLVDIFASKMLDNSPEALTEIASSPSELTESFNLNDSKDFSASIHDLEISNDSAFSCSSDYNNSPVMPFWNNGDVFITDDENALKNKGTTEKSTHKSDPSAGSYESTTDVVNRRSIKNDDGYLGSINETTRKITNRKTYILDDKDVNDDNNYKLGLSSPDSLYEDEVWENAVDTKVRDSLYSVEEYDEDADENEYSCKSPAKPLHAVNQVLVNNFKDKQTEKPVEIPKEKSKRFKFTSLFSKKDKKNDSKDADPKKIKPKPANDDQKSNKLPPNRLLVRSRTFSSAVDIRSEKSSAISRTPSLRKKITNFINKDAPNLIRRSLSFRDINKGKDNDKSREKLAEMKNREWATSLQNLVETDFGISYNDLSFINYDVQNTISYRRPKPKISARILHRTQSLTENISASNRTTSLSRGVSIPRHFKSTIDLTNSGALSLPSFDQLSQDNVDLPADESSPVTHRYRRRPQSINSDDGRSKTSVNGSFRSAGSGCAKLKRQNACRQKSRDALSLQFENRVGQENQTVRSRSLNHLDELEMRQGVATTTDPGLKDSRSEPDCTSSPAPQPARTIPTPEPQTPTNASFARKHMLSRSQKSSSECFSVNFEVGDESTWENEIFFPAVRGINLTDSLAKLCELRNIDLSSCDAWLQDKDSNTNAQLSFSQDTAVLVGRHVRITAKDSSNKKFSGTAYGNHSRKPSTSSKSRAGSFFNTSTEDANVSGCSTLSQDGRLLSQDYDLSKKQPKQRWSGFFSNNKDTKMEQLVDQLNHYAKNGVPTCHIYPQGQCESIDALYKLEDDWKDIIDCTNMPERLQQQQIAIWELIKTEVAYIKTLKVVTDLFLACLKNLQSVHLLKEIDTEKLFSNITEILDANVLFWRNSLFPLVRAMRKDKQPPCIETMCEGFLKIKDTFQAYFRYCAEQARCQHYCRENHAHNELFTAYLVWCETQKECNRLRLMDILVQPMQRLTKYGLLLKAILKNTDEEVEKDNLIVMIRSVDDFVNNVNLSLKQKQDNERLRGIMARIESYDIVESKDDDLEKLLKSFNQLDLNRPMLGCAIERKRHLLLEGDLKLKDSNASKMEVHCFLLTDMLLVCKPSTKKGGATMRVIRQPYLVDRLVVTELNKETPSLAIIYKNEFDMAVAAFILQNNDAKKLKSWKESINKAQSLYAQAKQTSYTTEESLDTDFYLSDYIETDTHSLQLVPRSPLASSSRASRVSSLAHSHSGSVEMNDQSSIGSANQSRAVSVEAENRTASISSDEGVQPLPPDKSPVSQKNSFKHRLFNKTPNTLSVQPFGNLGQSLPNLTLGSPNLGTLSLNLNQNTLSVPSSKNSSHLLSPTHRGISYPPPSPTRGNLKRGLAISQNKNPPLLKTRHVTSTAGAATTSQVPSSFDFDVPVIADDQCENFSRGQHRQAMLKRIRNDNKRYHTAGVVDDIKKNDSRDASIHKRLSWNCNSQEPRPESSDHT